ncbi:hypothetical protein ATANTOWER_016512 [Ataeniobius toweri]|uniref:Secreted protein n=1 Tax=Ataeniobius toweri TaxID=208326 RepID=A0ABU7CA72_9TELE|nr:hypothetical protein [Ataeniobius toweri]
MEFLCLFVLPSVHPDIASTQPDCPGHLPPCCNRRARRRPGSSYPCRPAGPVACRPPLHDPASSVSELAHTTRGFCDAPAPPLFSTHPSTHVKLGICVHLNSLVPAELVFFPCG